MTTQDSIILAFGIFYSRLWFLHLIFPYLLGMLIAYSVSRKIFKALFWLAGLIVFLMLGINFTIGMMMSSWGAVDPVEIRLLFITCIVMLGQSIFWAWLWKKNRSISTTLWRTVSVTALVVSLLIAIPATAIYAMNAGTRYVRSSVVAERLEIAGYVAYPGSEPWHQGYPYREAEFVDGRGLSEENLGLMFGVPDDFEMVLDFYEELFKNEGYETRRGLLRTVAEGAPRMDRTTGAMHTPRESEMGPGRPSPG